MVDADVKATIREVLNMAEPYVYTLATDEEYEEWSAKRTAILDVDAQGQGWQPVGYDDIFTAKGEPLRSDYRVLCEKWLDFNNVASDTKDGYEYAVCRLAPHASQADCPFCGGSHLLELRVQLDQKILVSCICVISIDDLTKHVFAEGYKRAQQDMQEQEQEQEQERKSQ